jgi:hypothetical protein
MGAGGEGLGSEDEEMIWSKKKNRLVPKWNAHEKAKIAKQKFKKEDLIEKKYMQSFLEARNKKMIDLPPNIIFTVSLSKTTNLPKSNPIEFRMQTLDPLFEQLTSPENKFDESALRKNLNKFIGPGVGPLAENILDPVEFDLEFYR